MDVVGTVRKCLARWDEGGEAQCRDLLAAPHLNPSDPAAHDVLSTVYHTIITATLETWAPPKSLSAQAVVNFVQSVLEGLPSPSSAKSPHAIVFGEILVDLIWAIDSELDDIHQDAKLALANAEQGNAPPVAEGDDATAVLARVAKAKQSAESDKQTLAETVKLLVSSGILDADVCRERLELPMIHNAGLIPDESAFQKKEVRARTALFYKQNKFNLLREQSEGYSKLTTELTSSLGPPHSPATGLPVESSSVIEARARPAWERVVGLVGYFDLDPNRALDIILDVFSVHIATHYSFFLALLACSPWAASPQAKSSDDMNVEPNPDMYKGKDLDEVLRLAECQSGHPPSVPQPPTSGGPDGSRVLAQVLGFKFAYYQLPDVMEPTPKNLYLTAAMLIREGFITLEDLYQHLSPTDNEMEAEHKKYLASVTSRIDGAKFSMLAMAAPLIDSSLGSGSSRPRQATPSEAKKPEPEKEMPNQKLGILNALLALGALRPALALLSKYRWIVDASPDIADLLLRVARHSIAGLYDTVIASQRDQKANFCVAKPRFGTTGVAPAPERKPQLTLWAPTPPSTSSTDFVFFFPQWTERIPLCNGMDDLVSVLEPLLRFVGLHVSRDPTFLTKFLRIARHFVVTTIPVDPETKRPVGTPDDNHPIRVFWFKAIRLYVIPAIPLIRGNAVCTVEVWNLLRTYDITQRWRLYGEWKDSVYDTHPELRVRRVQADRESKGILRRLSHQTIDALSGTVAKLAHSNPIIFFTNAVNQIMAYDNMSAVVILALNYVTIMGFDVLLYIVIEALANPHKSRVKEDGVNTTDWLQSLSAFIGGLFRRYSADLTPLLKYIVHQLYQGQTTEIVVLRELIWRMAGIEPLPNLSENQVAAMAGGPILRIEAVASTTRGARMDVQDVGAKAPSRLGRVLLDSGLALPLLVQVAQQRQACVFQAPDAHLKSLASLYDTTHGVLLQYLDFLTSPAVIAPEDYAKKILPPLPDLHQLYGISAPICMQIIRPTLNIAILKSVLEQEAKEKAASEEAEKRLKEALMQKQKPAGTPRIGSPAVAESATPADSAKGGKPAAPTEDVSMESSDNAEQPAAPAEAREPEHPWLPELYRLFDDVKAIAPKDANEVIGPGFYLTFWQLSTYELSPPVSRYEEETAFLAQLSREEDAAGAEAERSPDRAKRAKAYLFRERRKRYTHFIDLLRHELKEQTSVRSFTIKRLAKEKQHWFAHNSTGNGRALAAAFVEHCLHPRALLSPMDADYCAQIIKVVHLQGTPGFPTLYVYDKLLDNHVKAVIFSCSEFEARNYGRFLHGVLADLLKWHQDEEQFVQDNRVKVKDTITYLPGFMTRFQNKRANVALEDLMDAPTFREVCKKWHRKLTKCFIDCIESGEFMHVYNTIIVLKELLPVYPIASVYELGGPRLDIAINDFVNKEKRGDLKIIGRAYAASFKSREHVWRPRPPASTAPSGRPTPTATPAPERPRPTAPAPSGTAHVPNGRPPPTATGAPPSAPRAELLQANGNAAADRSTAPTSTRLAIESIPRPEVVKRIRPDTKSPAPKVNGDAGPKPSGPSDAMVVDAPNALRPLPAPVTTPRKDDTGIPRGPAGAAIRPGSPLVPSGSPIPRGVAQMESSRPPTPSPLVRSISSKDLQQSPRIVSGDSRNLRESTQAMPPPAIPSQTTSAQELRDSARQSRPSEKIDDKPARLPVEPRGQQPPSSAPPSRRRSTSPSSRPGTRNPSVESRASGGRSRGATGESERSEEKRDRDRHESRRDGRSRRDGDREKESDRDRDRGRDRHGDRERPRDRDRDRERDRDRDGHRERDRERDRDRDRHRDSDRDRDRHRREEKDRDRESRKEREGRGLPTGPSSSTAPNPDDRGLPARPDPSRRREDEALGKRRRPTEDDSDRASKRPSRKESHHEDRGRRSSDKDRDDRPRDSDRRRKERDQAEGESRSLTVDTKLGDKRIPDGPASARALPPSTPSAPRAMASGDPKNAKSDRDWRPRDQPPRGSPTGPGAPQSSQEPPQGPSLRSRISDKEPRSLPQGPSAFRNDSASDRKPENTSKDDREASRKRASSERETGDSSAGQNDPSSLPSKRPRINRTRWQANSAASSAAPFAKKSLMEAEKNGRGGVGRKD